MLTDLGKFLRKLRIDNDETEAAMAKKIGVSSAFLSAVENGKKDIPDSWVGGICKIYSFNTEQRQEFIHSVANSKVKIKIDLRDVRNENKKLAILFAREFKYLTNEQIEEMSRIMLKKHE